MSKKDLHIGVHSPLKPEDTPYQTYGCRAYNPDICANADTPKICAFVREDCICMKPPRSWKKQFEKLKNGE